MRLSARIFAFALGASSIGLASARAPGQPTTRAPASVRSSAETTSWPQIIEQRLDKLRARSEQLAPSSTDADGIELSQRLEPLVTRQTGSIGVHIRDLGSGATLFDHGGDRPLNPASNHKLVTAVAAAELLGPDYRFETDVVRDGDALYLVGRGDPSLMLDDLHELAVEVVGSYDLPGIRRIVVDDRAFSDRRFGPGYDSGGPGFSYMAPSGALSLQWNTIEIIARPARAGQPVSVRVDPPCAHVRVHSTARTGRGRKLRVETLGVGEHTVVRVEGALRPGHAPVRIRRRVYDPGQFAGSVFAEVLADVSGLERLPVSRGRAPADAVRIATHRSAPLGEAMRSALKFSNNFATEQVLRTLGWRATGEPGGWTNGRATIERFWRALGRDPGALRFENASGLSRGGRLTARALVDMIALAMQNGSPAAAMVPSLPAAGRDGTLRNRLRKSDGRVRAKTGTMSGVSALTGVVVSKDGRRQLGFSILVGSARGTRRGRQFQDRVVLALLDHVSQAQQR